MLIDMNMKTKDIVSLFGILLAVAAIMSVFIAYKAVITGADYMGTNAINAIVTVQPTCYTVVTPNSLNFGSVTPGTMSATQTSTVSDTFGNVDSFPWISGTSWGFDNGAGASSFYVTNTIYANGITAAGIGTSTPLTTTATNTYGLIEPLGTVISNVLSFDVNVPSGQATAVYNQIIIITDTC